MGAMGDQRSADAPAGDDLLQKAIARIIATHETDLDQALAEGDFGVKDALASGCGGSQRFFTKDRLAGCDRRQNVFLMGRPDGGDNDSIHVVGCNDFVSGGLGPAAKVLGNLLSPRRIDIGHCHHTRPGQRVRDTADMILPNVSGPDDSDTNGHAWKR
jgi:hypothetical protein